MTNLLKRVGSLSRSELEDLLIDSIVRNQEDAKKINSLKKELDFNVRLVDKIIDKINEREGGKI